MALFLNNTKMTTATTGTGTITLGSAVSGFLTWAQGGGVDQCYYGYRIDDGSNWEVGSGLYTSSGTTLTRTVQYSSNSNTAINLSGTATVTCVMTAPDGTRQLIQEVVTSSSQASVTFSAFPATFRDLELRVRGRGTASATDVTVQLQFNGDTGSNYNNEFIVGFATSAPACGQSLGATSMSLNNIAAATAVANASGNTVINLLDYRGATFNKTVSGTGGTTKANSSGSILAYAVYGEWKNTSAITSVKVFLSSGNFVDNSVVSLYGLS